jgi:hypothetical protein
VHAIVTDPQAEGVSSRAMDLLREWRRRSFGAAAGAVVAPVAIIAAALAVGLGGGGLGGLGSLSQAFSGPELPKVAPLSRRGPAENAGRLLARVRRANNDSPARQTAVGTDTVASLPPSSSGPQGSDQTETVGSAPSGSFDPGGGTAPSGAGAPTAPTAAPAVTAAPTEAPASPVSAVGDTVKGVTDGLPVVGEPVGQVVDTVVDTVDGILPPG